MKVIDKKQADYLNCMTSKNAVSIGDGITRKRKEHGATENTNTILIEENYEGLKLNGTTPPRSAKKNDLQNMKLIENTSPSMDCGSLLDNAPLSQPTFKPKKVSLSDEIYFYLPVIPYVVKSRTLFVSVETTKQTIPCLQEGFNSIMFAWSNISEELP
jgi:hypothetical protein